MTDVLFLELKRQQLPQRKVKKQKQQHVLDVESHLTAGTTFAAVLFRMCKILYGNKI
jgi:hypothetical protein